MNNTKSETVKIVINNVVFTVDLEDAVRAGIVNIVKTHKVGNYYRHRQTGSIYILTSHSNCSHVSLVKLTGNFIGSRVRAGIVFNKEKITEVEFAYVSCEMELELIDNPLVK